MLGHFLKPEVQDLIRRKDWESIRVGLEELDPADVAEVIEDLDAEHSGLIFRVLPRDLAQGAFEYLPVDQQAELVATLGSEQLVNVLNEMAPDDRTRLFEELPAEVTKRALTSLRPEELKVARQLLGYPEDSAGRFMTPEYLALSPQMTAAQALEYLRENGRGRETLNIVYVLNERGVLLKDLRLSTLVMASPKAPISELEDRALVSIPATMDKEEVVATFEKYDRAALPVTDSQGVMLGIITHDDVLDVAAEEATEDIQRLGGMEALEAPYFEVGPLDMLKKRAGWLTVLFLGQTLTATAMGYFEGEIEKAVVLTLFIPLIISSGGNSGSQATSLIIRALAVRDVDLGDWWRVMKRELFSGFFLGVMLGVLGLMRIALWPSGADLYGPHYAVLALTVAISLIGVVLFGSLCGAMLPFVLRRLGLDPAAASAPFVATLVDVTGLVIYFGVATLMLRGTVL